MSPMPAAPPGDNTDRRPPLWNEGGPSRQSHRARDGPLQQDVHFPASIASLVTPPPPRHAGLSGQCLAPGSPKTLMDSQPLIGPSMQPRLHFTGETYHSHRPPPPLKLLGVNGIPRL